MSRSRVPEQWVKACAQRLQSAREAAGYTQETMAEELKLQVKTYAKYETRTPLPQHLIGTVCRMLDLDPLVFLDGYGREARPGPKLRRIK